VFFVVHASSSWFIFIASSSSSWFLVHACSSSLLVHLLPGKLFFVYCFAWFVVFVVGCLNHCIASIIVVVGLNHCIVVVWSIGDEKSGIFLEKNPYGLVICIYYLCDSVHLSKSEQFPFSFVNYTSKFRPHLRHKISCSSLFLHSFSLTFKLLSMASYGGELLLDSSSSWSDVSNHLSSISIPLPLILKKQRTPLMKNIQGLQAPHGATSCGIKASSSR